MKTIETFNMYGCNSLPEYFEMCFNNFNQGFVIAAIDFVDNLPKKLKIDLIGYIIDSYPVEDTRVDLFILTCVSKLI